MTSARVAKPRIKRVALQYLHLSTRGLDIPASGDFIPTSLKPEVAGMKKQTFHRHISFAALVLAGVLPLFPAYASDNAAIPTAVTMRDKLVERIASRLDDPGFAQSHWGVLIESLDTGEIWYERNADRLFIPASSQKIFTAAAAYRALGPDWRFTTTVHHTGEIAGGALRGDLVVVGNGDPTISERFHDDPREVFLKWSHNLRRRGIRRITGNIVGDDNAWEDRHTGSGWPRDAITPWYYAEFGPLQLNENLVNLTITPPRSADGIVEILPNPPSGYFTIVNEIQVVEQGSNQITMNRPMFSNTITIGGTVVAGAQPFDRTATITNPTLFYVTVLREALQENGISVDGAPLDIDDLADWRHGSADLPEIDRHLSPPLREIAPILMKYSRNVYGETLVYAMGWREDGFGTFAAGVAVVERELTALGVVPGSYRFADGSGLSRFNMLSPRMLNSVNRKMRAGELRDLWLDTQSIAGVDGTLRNIRPDSPMARNVRAKTGTLFAVRTLSGYVETAAGERIVFSMLNNGSLLGARAVDTVIHDILEMIATHDTRPDAAGGNYAPARRS